MPQFQAFSPDNEVIGQLMLAFIHCSNREHIMPYLEKHGLTDIQPDQWYLEQPWLDALSEMAGEGKAMFDFVSVGMKMAELLPAPQLDESASFGDILMAWGNSDDTQYNYRGSDIGYRKAETFNDGHIKVTFRYGTPDDIMYGFIYGYCRRFVPSNVQFVIKYDDDIIRHDHGGEETVVHITWN